MSKTALFSRKIPGGVFSIYDESQTTGNIFWVNSVTGTDAVGNGTHPDRTFASINFAISQCTANNGDRIYTMPLHVESVVGPAGVNGQRGGRVDHRHRQSQHAAGAVAVKYQFDGRRQRSQRQLPQPGRFDRDQQCRCGGFNITAPYCEFDRVDFIETTSKQLFSFLITNAAAKDLTVTNCVHRQATAPGTTGIWINLAGADRARIENNRFMMSLANNANSTVMGSQTAAVDLVISNNLVVVSGAGTLPIPINFNQINITGVATDNRVGSGKTNIAGSIALGGIYGGLNYGAHTANKNGLLEPVVDTQTKGGSAVVHDCRVFISTPTYDGRACCTSSRAVMVEASLRKIPIFMPPATIGSLLAFAHNLNWAHALGMAETGQFPRPHFLNYHSDIQVMQPGWLDTLVDMMEEYKAAVLSVNMAIKDNSGETSTGLSVIDEPWNVSRLSIERIAELPDPFSIEDVAEAKPGQVLLVNTGIMLVDLRREWCFAMDEKRCLKAYFTINDRIRCPIGRPREVACQPEDWNFSRMAAEAGEKVMATSRIKTIHWGQAGYQNWSPEKPRQLTEEEKTEHRLESGYKLLQKLEQEDRAAWTNGEPEPVGATR